MGKSSVRDDALFNGLVVQSSDVDNNTATATLPAAITQAMATMFVLTGIHADYSAAVALIRTITVTYTPKNAPGTTATIVLRWDFSNGAAIFPFPGAVACEPGTQATAAVIASGTGGITGRIHLYYFAT